MGGLVDIHCHLLPCVDDGCASLPESLELARRMVDAGFTDAICTPHIQPAMPENERKQIAKAVAQLQVRLDAAKVSLRLHVGGENRCGPENVSRPLEELNLAGEGKSRGGSLGARFFLFDDWGPRWPKMLTPMVHRLLADGITPILAHPERTPWCWEEPLKTADALAEKGVLLQLNAWTLTGPRPYRKGSSDPQIYATANALLEAGRYSFIATDAHHAADWSSRQAGLDCARSIVGEAEFLRLHRENPGQLLPARATR